MDTDHQINREIGINSENHSDVGSEQYQSGQYSGSDDKPKNLPAYLAGYYRCAYVWPLAVWFFDHQWIINAILFGQYRKIMQHTLRLLQPGRAGKTLQIASVYGELVPTLAAAIDDFHVIDIAPVQLQALKRKLKASQQVATITRMNAEQMDYPQNSFDTVLVFLLLHEMPPDARRRCLREACRIIRPGGRLVIAEYGRIGDRHFLHRFKPMRWLLTTAEPYLKGFWNEDLVQLLQDNAMTVGKHVELEEYVSIFTGFYRLMSFRIL